MKYKFLEHTADIKFQAFGKSIEKVFENSALALKEIIFDELKIKEKKEKKIEVKGKDFESLLYNFLEDILYFAEGEDFAISKVAKLKITKDFKLNAVVIGDKASDYEVVNKVKAVTYNEMFVKKIKNQWVAQVVLDV